MNWRSRLADDYPDGRQTDRGQIDRCPTGRFPNGRWKPRGVRLSQRGGSRPLPAGAACGDAYHCFVFLHHCPTRRTRQPLRCGDARRRWWLAGSHNLLAAALRRSLLAVMRAV